MGPIRTLYHTTRLRRGAVPIGDILHGLQRSQWLHPAELEAVHEKRLRDLLRFASRRIPFYRRRFQECGLDPAHDRLPHALVSVPPLTRDDLRSSACELVDIEAAPEDRIEERTGGSTGEPTRFVLDRADVAASRAEMLRHFEWVGIAPGVRHAFLWGADRDSWPYRGLRGALKQRLENFLWINSFDLDEDALADVVERLRSFRPRVLVGYASSLVHLARHCLRVGTWIPSVAAIESSAETLTPADREIVHRAFAAEVFDRYGSREVGNVAHECSEHDGLHVSTERLHVEIVDDAGLPVAPGETGRVLVTTLLRRTMPLIRYEIGDLAVARSAGDECPCGRGLPRIGPIRGRTSDVIRGPSGRLLHGEFFTHLFYDIPGVRRFQVVQEDARRLVVSVVSDAEAPAGVGALLRRRILQEGDPLFDVEVRAVDSIVPGPTGKFRFTFSRLSPTSVALDEPAANSEECGARSA
ncbi:MAG: phenylacetate--CoA ligase family protein [Planctomycetes bacterium]|nr:phenylacetate--CoA ligase family protein [Planctomycetota bacterium]MBI3845858.1 phenylacetate--CoA ligase family protein [Planctomycetota bacterium]